MVDNFFDLTLRKRLQSSANRPFPPARGRCLRASRTCGVTSPTNTLAMPHTLGSTYNANAMNVQDPHDCGRGKAKLCDSTSFHDSTTGQLERFIGTKMIMRPYCCAVHCGIHFELAHVNRSSTCLSRLFNTSKFVAFDGNHLLVGTRAPCNNTLHVFAITSLGRKGVSFGLVVSTATGDQPAPIRHRGYAFAAWDLESSLAVTWLLIGVEARVEPEVERCFSFPIME